MSPETGVSPALVVSIALAWAGSDAQEPPSANLMTGRKRGRSHRLAFIGRFASIISRILETGVLHPSQRGERPVGFSFPDADLCIAPIKPFRTTQDKKSPFATFLSKPFALSPCSWREKEGKMAFPRVRSYLGGMLYLCIAGFIGGVS